MNALHYAVFFDSSEVVEALAEHNPSLVMSVCSEFNDGNCLHIAAANLSLEAAKVAVSMLLLISMLLVQYKLINVGGIFVLNIDQVWS